MSKRKALGRGLSSLIPDAPPTAAPGVLQIDVGLIGPSPQQPRKSFDDGTLEELASSIRAHGLLQPVVVSRDGERYRLIVGERRWRAAVQAGIKQIPAILREVDDRGRLEMALIENLQRQELNPLEEAQAYQLLVDEFHVAHEELARRVGKSRPYVSNLLRLLNLEPSVRERVAAGKLSMGHARALAGLADPAAQKQAAEMVIKRSLSVRETEALVSRLARGDEAGDGAGSGEGRKSRKDPNVRAAEERLKRAMGTEVRITGGPEKGRIVIEFVNAGELQRLFEMLQRAARSAPPPPADPRSVSLPGRRTGATEGSG